MASSNNCSMKMPPKFVSDDDYENWKRDIEIWRELTDLPKTKQALAMHLSLNGRARIASSEISVDSLKNENGVDTLINKLDKVFLKDEGRRQFAVFHELYNLRRSPETSVNDFLVEFEHVYYKFAAQKMILPDPVIAFMLLASCKFTDSEVQLIMSAITEVTYDNMKSALKRIFGSDIGNKYFNKETKVEPVFEAVDETNETFYGRERKNNRRPFSRVRGSWRGGRGSAINRHNSNNFAQLSARRTNPVDREGKVSRCIICDSKYHWARQCPDSYENNGNNNNNSNYANDENGKQNQDDVENEMIHLSLFVGYANENNRSKKLDSLMEESYGCALLDSGCSTTVCGSNWLENYCQQLSEHDRQNVIEKPSNSNFTFGDGNCMRSKMQIILPCYINGKRSNIETEVVSCNIPLLLSKKSMKKGKMCLDFGNDTINISGEKTKLTSSKSGHYLMPLSL